MTARSDLAELIKTAAPDAWEVFGYPTGLSTFDVPGKSVAVVVEQRGFATGTTSPTDAGIPTTVELAVWVVVDGTRGAKVSDLEDALEAAAETMVRILEPLPVHVWNGTAERTEYNPSMPAYQFQINAHGAITPEE